MIDISKILEKEPTLTAHGIDGAVKYNSDEELDIKQIQKCVDWLETTGRSKIGRPYATSYGYKHLVEQDMGGYVSNGNFIAAVIHLGIPYKRKPDSASVYVGV